MDEKTLQSEEHLESVKHLISRRRLLKQAGAAGIALTAMYAAPSFSSFGPRPAYASITGATLCNLCPTDGSKRRPRYLTFVYTGNSGNGVSSASGHDKAPVIVGSMNGQSPVTIKWMKKDDSMEFDRYVVNLNGSFTLDYTKSDHGHDHIDADVRLLICNADDTELLQEIDFHSSCSAPLSIGDSFGGVELIGYEDEEGRINCEDSPGGSDEGCPTEGKKIQSLAMLYQGQDATNLSHTQDSSKVKVYDHNGGPAGSSVFIQVCDALTSPSNIWFSGNVGLNSSFVATAGTGSSKLPNETFVKIYASNGGDLLQTIEFHTSCSQPLVVGNEFGSITIETGFVLVDK